MLELWNCKHCAGSRVVCSCLFVQAMLCVSVVWCRIAVSGACLHYTHTILLVYVTSGANSGKRVSIWDVSLSWLRKSEEGTSQQLGYFAGQKLLSWVDFRAHQLSCWTGPPPTDLEKILVTRRPCVTYTVSPTIRKSVVWYDELQVRSQARLLIL